MQLLVLSIFINIQNGYELDELHDVLVTTPSQGNLLTYNSSSALWVNSNQLSGNYGLTGSLSATSLSASSITGSYSGNGSALTNLTASSITNFTNDVRAQFNAGTGIQINAGAISASNVPNSSLQNSAVSIGSTAISLGTTGSDIQGLTTLTASTATGTNAQFTNITASAISASSPNSKFASATFDNISVTAGAINAVIGNTTQSTGKFTTLSASSTLQAGGAATIAGNLTVNGGQTSVQSFTASAGISSSAGLVIGGNARVLGNITTDNNLIVSGNTTLGNASTDIVTSNAQFTASSGLSASVIDVSDKATTRTNLGLAIGTNVQAYDATLATIAGLTTAADRYIYFTGIDTASVGTITSHGRSILDDADAAATRTTLGLGTIATQNANSVAITGGAIDSTAIGATGQSTGKFTSLSASTTLDVGGSATFGDSSIDQFTVNSKTQFLGSGAFLINRPSISISGNVNFDTSSTQTINFFGNEMQGTNFIIKGGTINATQIGNTAPSTANFTQLTASAALISTNLDVSGDISTLSNVSFGSSTAHLIGLSGTTSARDILPIINDTYNLGSAAKKWSTLYADDINASGSNGQIIIGTGSTNSLIDCSTGASNTYRGIRTSVGTTEKCFFGTGPNSDELFLVRPSGSDGAGSFNAFVVTNDGLVEITQLYNDKQSGLRIYDGDGTTPEYWQLHISSSNHLYLFYNNTTNGGYFSNSRLNGDVNAYTFTGQHRSIADSTQIININEHTGLIAISTGKYINLDMTQKPTINESLATIKLSSQRNQKSVWGVISECEDANESTREYRVGIFVSIYQKSNNDDNRVVVNSLGEGGIWVCNINGNLENGDYITTCEIPGHGMKQDDDLLHNYTVAKITQDCFFELNNPNYDCVEFEFSGSTYRKAFVGCTYHCG